MPVHILLRLDALGSALDDLWVTLVDKRRTDPTKREQDVHQKARCLLERLIALEVDLWETFAAVRSATRS